jgi:DNA-binding transcriptional regulator YhcF (GntR family)
VGIVKLKKESKTPKYRQIIASIENAIVKGDLQKGDKLPSLNVIKNKHSLSRDTVLTAFNDLKNRGIINSVVGKGYYVSSVDVKLQQKIFVLFDELNSFKEDLYNAFLTNLGSHIEVEIYFHHFNINIFNKLINDNIGNYSSYVIMPANLKNTQDSIKNLPKDKVFILDQIHEDLNEYPAVYQNFEKDIFTGLESVLEKLLHYKNLILLYNDDKQPKGILDGFLLFCKQYNLQHKVLDSLNDRKPKNGEIFIILDDKNLIRVIKKIKEEQLILAKEVGIISVNDTILKEVVENGITTISTDFNLMGKKLAQMILNDEKIKVENPSRLILRKSL